MRNDTNDGKYVVVTLPNGRQMEVPKNATQVLIAKEALAAGYISEEEMYRGNKPLADAMGYKGPRQQTPQVQGIEDPTSSVEPFSGPFGSAPSSEMGQTSLNGFEGEESLKPSSIGSAGPAAGAQGRLSLSPDATQFQRGPSAAVGTPPEQPKPQSQPQPKEPREKQYFTGSIATALNAIDSPGTPYGFLGVGDFIDDAARAIASGYSSGQAGSNSLDVMIDGAAADSQTIQKMIDASARASSLGASDEMNDFTRVYQSEGESFFGLLKGLAYNPGVVPEIIISSFSGLANQKSLQAGGATIAGGAAYGAAAGSAAGGVGAAPGAIGGAVASIPYAFAAASTVLETGSTFAELLQEELGGKEFNVENVRAILQDPEKLSDLRTRAAGKGITIGAINGLTARLAGSVGVKIIARGGSKAGAAGAGSLIEAVGGSGGEAAGRLVAGQKMDISEIGLEGIAEIPMGVIDVGAAAFGSPKYTINGERRTERDIQDIINRATPEELSRMKIEIDNDKKGYGNKIKDLIETGEIKKQVRSANAGIDDVSLGRLVVLEKELVSLSENKTQSAKERTSQIKSEIADIRSRATYAPAPNYSINGISMPAEDFRRAIASMSSKEFVSSKINVENGENEIVDFLANKASVSSKITGIPPSTMEWSGEDVRYKGDRDVLSPAVEFSGEDVRYKGDKDALSPVVEFSGKQVEPKDKDIKPFITYGRGGIVQEAAEPTIRDVINMQGRLFLQRGDVLAGNISMHPEEKGMVVIVDSSGNMYDIGTISEIGDKKIGDIGVEIDDTAGQFRMSEAGIINVRGINYIAPRGLDHIVRSEDGGILEVILPRVSSGGRARKGKKVFTLSDAEEIAYEITLKHIRDNANNAEIEAALAEARQAVQDEGAGRTAGPAAATETKSATGKVRQEVTPTPTADAVQVGTTAQVGAQPVGPEVTGQEGGAGVGPSVQGPTAPQAGGAQGQVTPTTEPTAEGPVRPEAPAGPAPTTAPTPNKETVAKMKDLAKAESGTETNNNSRKAKAQKKVDALLNSDARLMEVRDNFDKAVADLEKSGKLKVRCQ